MINNIIDENSLAFFKNQIGKSLVSIEIGESEKKFNRSYGKLRISFSDGATDIYNIEKCTEFMEEDDDISGFSCEVNVKGKYLPYLDEATSVISINEIITYIYVIRDTIEINDNYETAVFDMAIVIKTDKNIYMISRDWQYSELIHIYNHENYNAVYPIKDVIDSWNNFGEYNVNVKRTAIHL